MKLKILLSLLSVTAVTGCQSYWDPEANFGSTVNGAVTAQIQNPKAPQGYPKSVVGLDGQSAKLSVESYQKTFDRKQTPPASTAGSMVGGSTGLSVQ